MTQILIEDLCCAEIGQQGLFHGTHLSYVDSILRDGLNANVGKGRALFLKWGWREIGRVENKIPRLLLDENFPNELDAPDESGVPGVNLLDASLRGAVCWEYGSVAFAIDYGQASDYAGGYGESVAAARALSFVLRTRYPTIYDAMPLNFAPYAVPLQSEDAWAEAKAVFRLIEIPPFSCGHFHSPSSDDRVEALQLHPAGRRVQITELMFKGVVPPNCLELVNP